MTDTHLMDDVSDYVLGDLDPAATARWDVHVAGCAQCQAEVDAFSAELVAFAELAGEVAPSATARERVTEALARPGRWFSFVGALARLADIADGAMQSLVAALDDLSRWEPGPADGITIFHVDGGPTTAGAVVGFVKIPAGGSFPEHTHQGRETVLIIQGTQRDSDGSTATVGDVVVREPHSTHTIFAGPDEDLIFLVVVHGGVMVGDDLIGPDDPRI